MENDEVGVSARSREKLRERQGERKLAVPWIQLLLHEIASREIFVIAMRKAGVSDAEIEAATVEWAMLLATFGTKLGLKPNDVTEDVRLIKTLAQTDVAMHEKAHHDGPMQ